MIDVSAHRNKDGKLYMPSYPWGIDMNVQGITPDNGGPLVAISAKTKGEALEKAQQHCLKKVGNSAVVFRRRDGKVAIRYWQDSEGLQYQK